MIGSTIGNYRMLEMLGEGGMGVVYRALDVMLEREVAIKVLNPDLARRASLAERFRTEAVILARLSHPNIATLYGLSRHGDSLLMIMEYIKGESLEAKMSRAGRLQWNEASSLICQVLDALQYAHQMAVIHRDIKPANLMIAEGKIIKVMDFGIARVLGSERQTKAGDLVGTLAYMPPEQVRGVEVDCRADIYATAAVLYEMLTGQCPFIAPCDFDLMQMHVSRPPRPPDDLAPGIPEWLSDAVMRALAKLPEGRFQSAQAFKAALCSGLAAPHSRPEGSGGMPPTRLYQDSAADSQILKPTRVAAQYGSPQGPMPEPRETRIAAGPALAGHENLYLGASASGSMPDVPLSARKRTQWLWICGAAVLFLISISAWLIFRSHPAVPPPPTVPQAAVIAPPPAPVTPPAAEPAPPVEPAAEFKPEPAEPKVVTSVTPVSKREPSQKGKPPISAPRVEPQREKAPGSEPEAPKTRVVEQAPTEPVVVAPAPAVPSEDIKSAPNAAPEPVAEFKNKIKALILQGDKTKERDVTMRMESDRIVISDNATGVVLKNFSYRSISNATYSQSKSPPQGGGSGSTATALLKAPVNFFKGNRHWFTLQTPGDSIILRLDKDNYSIVLPAFEMRSGKKVKTDQEED